MSDPAVPPQYSPAEDQPAPILASHSLLTGMLVAVSVTAALWALHLVGRTLTDVALLAVWAALTGLLATGLFVRARMRRRAFLRAYLQPHSTIARRWRGGVLMAVRVSVLAATLAAILLAAVLRIQETAVWVLLIVATLVIVPIYRGWLRVLAPQANANWLPEFAWRLTIATAGIALVLAMVILAMQRAQPELSGVGLDAAIWYFVEQESARSETALIFLEMAAAKDGLKLWLGQQLLPQPGISFAQAAGWAVILAEEALFVWSYLSLLSAAVITTNQVTTRSGRNHAPNP